MIFLWEKHASDNIQPQINHCKNKMVEPNIDFRIASNIPIMISPLGSSYVYEKQITLKELD